MDELQRFLLEQRSKCERLLKNFNETNNSCPPNYDGIYCWPATPCKTMARLSCPLMENKNKSMSRWCSANVTKITNNNQTIFEWLPSNNTECTMINTNVTSFGLALPTPDVDLIDLDLYWWHIQLYTFVRIGYATSIISLLTALGIYILFHRLQNARVRIHINLFISMAVQAMIWLLQGVAFAHRIFLTFITADTYSGKDASIVCRLLMVFGNYFELASFSWILMESWYFYVFICRAPYKECTSIKPLIICGWGLPFLVIIPYVTIYVLSSSTNFCWVDVDIKANILAVPIFIIILLNLFFFILNARVLFIKINCTVLCQRKMQFWKWFKSTLMLVPLFGAHDIFFSVEPWIEEKVTKAYFYHAVRIACSFQGLIVSVLHCFLNNEVKTEIKRVWLNWKSIREIDCNHCRNAKQHNRDQISNKENRDQTKFYETSNEASSAELAHVNVDGNV